MVQSTQPNTHPPPDTKPANTNTQNELSKRVQVIKDVTNAWVKALNTLAAAPFYGTNTPSSPPTGSQPSTPHWLRPSPLSLALLGKTDALYPVKSGSAPTIEAPGLVQEELIWP